MSRRLIFAIVFIAFIWIAPLLLTQKIEGNGYGRVGTNDFIEYWTSYQLFKLDQNFYDSALLQGEQLKLDRQEERALMMWNPPWILPLLSPVLELPFLAGAWSWVVVNFILVALIGCLLWQTYSNSDPPPILIVLTILFYPVFETIRLGQVSLVVTLGMAGWLWAVTKKQYTVAGLFLVLMSIKPHVPYLVLFAIAWWFIKERPWKMFYAACGAFGFLLLLTLLHSPTSFSYWLGNLAPSEANGQVDRVVDWVVPTLVGWTRHLIQTRTGNFATWPMVVYPAAAVFITGVLLISRKLKPDWPRILPPLICISAMTSPFGWIFDHSILLIPQVALAAKAYDSEEDDWRRYTVLLSLIGAQLFVFFYSGCCIKYHHEFFWFPLMMLALWFGGKRLLRD